MIEKLFNIHPVGSIVLLATLSFIVGIMEQIGFKRTDLACITWFFGVLVVSVGVASFDWLGIVRWPLGFILLIVGSLLIVRIYRRR